MRRWSAALVASAVLLNACAATPVASGPPVTEFDGSGPGSLVESTPFGTADVRITRFGGTAQRITYRSTSGIDGSQTVVTGAVFTPGGAPPEGGWPVVAFGHATVGILKECAPSSFSTLLGHADPVAALVDKGYLVVMPDFQGLGSAAPHPYLEPRTLGYNMIDAVQAARELEPNAGTRWVAYGGSQGGQAAWAANELAGSYGSGLELLGAVALAPPADMTAMASGAADKTLTADQVPLLQWVVNAMVRSGLPLTLSDYVHGNAAANNESLLLCSGSALDRRNALAAAMDPADLVPSSPAAVDALRNVLAGWTLPLPDAAATTPMLVMQGQDDSLVLADWTRSAVVKACEAGETVEWVLRTGEGHADLDTAPGYAWIEDRFAGRPAVDSCPTLIAPPPPPSPPTTESAPEPEQQEPEQEPQP